MKIIDWVRRQRQLGRDGRRLDEMAEALRLSAKCAGSVKDTSGRQTVVTLTSFAKRFKYLHLTIDSLFNQTLIPNQVVLYLGRQDEQSLTRELELRVSNGLQIRFVEDLRSYTKLVYALSDYPDVDLITVDDDLIYSPDMLEQLVAGRGDDTTIICHRAHRLLPNGSGGFMPYTEWDWDVQDSAARKPSTDIMPTGVSGVLYPPGALPDSARDAETFMRLCPRADDVWFYWMARLNGTRHKKVGGKFRFLEAPQTQQFGLRQTNLPGGNDSQIAAMLAEFGSPITAGEAS